MREAVNLYNAKAVEWGKPLNIFKSEDEHHADLVAKLAKRAAGDDRRAHVQEQLYIGVPGLTGIGRMRKGTFRVAISFQSKQQYIGRTGTVREAVDVYNEKAAEVGRPLNVFKSEDEHQADIGAKLAELARTNAVPAAELRADVDAKLGSAISRPRV